jgi:PPM family protein phosphatase
MNRPALLQSLPLFAGVPAGEIDRLAELAEWRSIPVGMVLMEEGERGDSLFVVVEGRFLVDVGTAAVRQRIAEVGPGEILGETCLFRRTVVRSARVAALGPGTVIRLGIGDLDVLARSGSRLPLLIERAVLHTLTERITRSRELIEEVLVQPAQQRPKGIVQRLRALVGLGA